MMHNHELNEMRKDIATACKKQRLVLNLSLEDLAGQVGMQPRTIERFEAGKIWFGVNQLIEVLYALNMQLTIGYEAA